MEAGLGRARLLAQGSRVGASRGDGGRLLRPVRDGLFRRQFRLAHALLTIGQYRERFRGGNGCHALSANRAWLAHGQAAAQVSGGVLVLRFLQISMCSIELLLGLLLGGGGRCFQV